jgi:aspartate aminotransferase
VHCFYLIVVVFDFSLGNPDVPPPRTVAAAIREIADDSPKPLSLGYGPNAGLPAVRAALAERLSEEQHVELSAQHIIVTSGAAGALNTIFRATLEQGDKVVCFAPYFVEYGFYAANHGGTLKPVKSKPLTFEIDIKALQETIGPKTRAMIINSPNNPSGVVYSKQELDAIANVLREKSKQFGRPIFLISDEPYRFLTYDDVEVPPVLPSYDYSIVVNSFSKSLSMAGERIGYIAVNPNMPGVELLLGGMILANRILGFVNAPIIGQKILLKALATGVDVNIYDERRKYMIQRVRELGFSISVEPAGAFYMLVNAKHHAGNSYKLAFEILEKAGVGVSPGSDFGQNAEGYLRLSYANSLENIKEGLNRLEDFFNKR